MSETRKPRAIILESDPIVSGQARSVLEKEGWEVTCETVSKKALKTLAASKKKLFVLFISNFKLPKMEGDDILSKVKSISPFTQRMLIVPDDEPETLVKAVNKAEIHACIISPFSDENLALQARNCFGRFKHILKQERLKRITTRQNAQMFKIAKKLKKKSQAYQKLINEKNTRKRMLTSKKRKLQTQARLNSDIDLEALLEHKDTALEPEACHREFLLLCGGIKKIFDKVTDRYESDPVRLDIDDILHPPPAPEEKPEENEEGDLPAAETEEQDTHLGSHVDQVLKTAYTIAASADAESDSTDTDRSGESVPEDEPAHKLEALFDIEISQDQTRAEVKKRTVDIPDQPEPSVPDLLDFLLQKEVSYGIVDDEVIQAWLSDPDQKTVIIAQGEVAVPGKNGSVKYHFQIDFSNPGKINEDGSIDFRERGDIPYVEKGTLIAEKKSALEGKPGISISGIPIPVEDVFDPVFEAGSGVTLSEDGCSIHAEIDGQPHCDALGNLSVSPELVIPGDVDYETGNIDFKGNILVKGMIKEGFTVKGINLTAQEIEGATIEISGDLNVTAGITDAAISAHGNTIAKFINNSTITAFGNVTVSKEIIDSTIIISGACINSSGHIISSRISAKLGIEGGSIGTDASSPVKIKVGTEEHLQTLTRQIETQLQESVDKVALLKDEIKSLEDQDQELYERISEKAHVQDRAQLEIKEIKNSLPGLEKSNDLARLQQATQKIKQLKEDAVEAEEKLNAIFKTQDGIAENIERFKEQTSRLEENNKSFVIQKKALKEFAQKSQARPVVSVAKTITQDSTIRGMDSAVTLKENKSRCKIIELAAEENGMLYHEMQITDL